MASPMQLGTDGRRASASCATVCPTSQCSVPPTANMLPLAAPRVRVWFQVKVTSVVIVKVIMAPFQWQRHLLLCQ